MTEEVNDDDDDGGGGGGDGGAGGEQPGDVNSARRVLAVHGSLVVPSALAQALRELADEGDAGPLLLVDDSSRSRWTLTEAARLLGDEHGRRVVPLVLLGP